MWQKMILMKAIDVLLDLLAEAVKDTDNTLDDKVVETMKDVKKTVDGAF